MSVKEEERLIKDVRLALLTKTEKEWLQGNAHLSYAYQRKIKSDIKKKLQTFQDFELPLLIEKGLISLSTDVTANCNLVTANCNGVTTDSNVKEPNSPSFLQNKEALAGIRSRDLCLTKATLTASLITNTDAATPNPTRQVSYFPYLDSSFWTKYKEYLLKSFNRHTAKCRLMYAKEYSNVLDESNANSLLLLSNEKRIHIMKSLATLSKYIGCYDKWKKYMYRFSRV